MAAKVEEDAYFTVEASLVMPIVLAVIIIVMYIMFFRYDRCLMEQDCGILLVRGVSMQAANAEERVKKTNALQTRTDFSRYIAWSRGDVSIQTKRVQLVIATEGDMNFLFAGWQLEGLPAKWHAAVEYKGSLVTPTFFVRNCEKALRLFRKDERRDI